LKTLIILNPYARRWTALERRPEAEASLQAAGVDYTIMQTEFPGHGVEVARQASLDGYQVIVAAGGDSTINEVANGILLSGQVENQPVLGVLPMGTANDLAENLGIPISLDEAARVIANGNTRLLDVCQVNDRYFVNNSGVGLEPYITTIQMNIHRVQGIVRYLLATLIGIYRKPEWEMDIVWDSGSYHGPVTLVSIGNSPRTGGLFYLTPHANAFDGYLTFLVGSAPSRLQLLQLLPKAMRAGDGNVAEDKRAFETHTRKLQIKLNKPSPVHADGEVFDLNATELTYQIIPARLPLLLP
jgi:YegS/Rv2252/BmrU family lipid kinase